MNPGDGHPDLRLPALSIALLSAATLAYEVLLTRLFSIAQWHHFAYMVISIALLGFGASGTLLALRPRWVERFVGMYLFNATLFGLSALPCFLLAQRFAVHPEQLLWQPSRFLGVSAVYLLLALPFFFAANALALALMRFKRAETRVYAFDLLGAGLGSMGIVGLLYIVVPIQALQILACLGAFAALLGAVELRAGKRVLAVVTVFALALPVGFKSMPDAWSRLIISPYKALSQQLNVVGADIERERFSPLGALTVVRSPLVPFRHAPGLSFTAEAAIPEQRGVFTDGDAMTSIEAGGDRNQFAYLDSLTSALPYHLASPAEVVVLGAGGGSPVRQALYHGVPSVTAVELNPQLVELLRKDYAAFSGHLYDSPSVNLIVGEARGFFAGNAEAYDLIQLGLIDSFAASSAGLLALNENYLYTVEAFTDYLQSLTDSGYLAITRWVKLPPRDTLKLFATAVAALRQSGVANPGEHLLLIRGWQTSTLIVKMRSVTSDEINALREFCEERAFDVAYYPGMPEAEANRHNLLAEPMLYRGARALLGASAEQFFDDYKFNIRPATDNRPYFYYFFKWQSLPEIVSLIGQGGVPLLESGYMVLLATLLQAVLISAILLLLPLWKRLGRADVRRFRTAWYFFALGVAFLFVEIAFIQAFIRFLHQPVLAVAVTLGGFLVFAGVGSYLAGKWQRRATRGAAERAGGHASRLIVAATLAIACIGTVYILGLSPLVFEPLAGEPMPVKLAVTVALTALLAIPMGMPFPLGLSELGKRSPPMVPVAWAINGCASVISAVLATLLAIHFGFTVVLVLAFALYASAAASFDFAVPARAA